MAPKHKCMFLYVYYADYRTCMQTCHTKYMTHALTHTPVYAVVIYIYHVNICKCLLYKKILQRSCSCFKSLSYCGWSSSIFDAPLSSGSLAPLRVYALPTYSRMPLGKFILRLRVGIPFPYIVVSSWKGHNCIRERITQKHVQTASLQ